MRKLILNLTLIFVTQSLLAQVVFDPDTVTTRPFDYGKMWTFDDAPVEYFAETYNFNPDQQWMNRVRLASLRLPGCSAGFVSENGLIITNHHCTRTTAVLNSPEEENVLTNGFYAETMDQERKLNNFYADQLLKIEDITQEVNKRLNGNNEAEVLQAIENEYSKKPEWEGLTIQSLSFYSGGKYSLYGFKRFTDIRLVFLPENELGFFGGDPDNFTYPRYALDCAFLRAYDENGNPVNSVSHYYPFNPDGIVENEPIFVIGNPGSTGRFRTMAQLKFDKEVQLPVTLSFIQARKKVLTDLNKTLKSDSLQNVIFMLSNAEKSYGGRLEGLHNEYFMTRKEKLENQGKEQYLAKEGTDYWQQMEGLMQSMKKPMPETILLNPSPFQGKVIQLIHAINKYGQALESDKEETITKYSNDVSNLVNGFDAELEQLIFSDVLAQLKLQSSQPQWLNNYLNGMSPKEKSTMVISESKIINSGELPKSAKTFSKSKDPLILASKSILPVFQKSAAEVGKLNATVTQLEQKIISANFSIGGTSAPPDATFSLRISDGFVKGYPYNGTLAPYKTTYYGLYARHASFDGEEPFSLPERWMNPPIALLKAPLNFVGTFDTIGGNSGSPVINRNAEIVGLNFDSTIERLPIRSILYDPQYGRSVGVAMGGVAAALEHIYKANRLLDELQSK